MPSNLSVVALLAAQTFTVGILPKGDPQDLKRAYANFGRYLASQVGMPVDLQVPPTYSELLAGCAARKFHLVYLGGYLYIKAHAAGYELVAQSKDSASIRSTFITNSISDIRTLGDLKGKSFAFGDRQSTSGFLMPTYFLDINNLPPRAIFKSVVHTSNHEETVRAVLDFKVDAGVVEERTLKRMAEKGKLQAGQIRVVWTTPPYPDNSWSMRADLDGRLKSRIVDAFMKPERAAADRFAVYDYIIGNAFYRPRHEHFGRIRDAVLLEGLVVK
ncbi:MAG: phosphate/phosphite/phosphonate ABC transporter substrate-binding protein [Candidatus Sericytochromatia bacterium]|nr:phosphate/phosphite/phosphonate ABC transporter substrate-binding protein [Candidatus Tanganyikabacteria bacterium]